MLLTAQEDSSPEGLRVNLTQPCNYPGAQVGLGAENTFPSANMGLPEPSL